MHRTKKTYALLLGLSIASLHGFGNGNRASAAPLWGSQHAAVPDSTSPAHGWSIPTENQGVTVVGERDGLVARFESAVQSKARVRLAAVANASFQVEAAGTHGFSVQVKALGTRTAAARIDRGLVRYEEAFGPGTEVFHRVSAGGTEDYVRFDSAPERPELRYEVSLGNAVSGLRQIGDSIEFLDAAGAPRLRIDTPYGIDSRHQRFAAHLALSGCAADTNPAPPWNRAVVPPGRRSCLVSVHWDSRVSYPAVIDPAWKAGTDMAAANVTYEMFLAKNTGGSVLAIIAPGNIAQVFDPTTGTWANTAAPPATFGHRWRLIPIAGDKSYAIASGVPGYVYDVQTGTWKTSTQNPTLDGNGVAAFDLGGGHVLVADYTGRVYDYDVVKDTYTAKMSSLRILGGNLGVFKVGPTKVGFVGYNTNKVTIYDTAADAWLYPGANVLTGGAENCGNLELLTSGSILAYGACGVANQAVIFDPVADTVKAVNISNTQNLQCQCGHTTSISYNKVHLIGGGRYSFDENTGAITDSGVFPSGAVQHGAIVKLNDGRALAAGGSANYDSAKVDLFGPSSAADCAPGSLFGSLNTPSYDSATQTCKACDGDSDGTTPLKCTDQNQPACQTGGANPLVGQCTQCSSTNVSKCTGQTPACDSATGKCTTCNGGFGDASATQVCPTAANPVCKTDGTCGLANGDNGTSASAPCPTSSNPYAKSDGSCGKCTSNTDCAGSTHAGPICNTTSGACGTACNTNTDCAANSFCDAGGTPKTCKTKLADGQTCSAAAQCQTGACNSGKCGEMMNQGSISGGGCGCTVPGGASQTSSNLVLLAGFLGIALRRLRSRR